MKVSDLPERLAKKIVVADTGCWEWTSSLWKGYGIIWWQGRHAKAHRVIYELLVAEFPPGLHSDHLCRNRGCVNPRHIEPVTVKENNRRKEEALQIGQYATHCVNGHEYTPENTRLHGRGRECRTCDNERRRGRQGPAHVPALRAADFAAIRERYAAGGVTQRQLAREFGISKTYVGGIIRGERPIYPPKVGRHWHEWDAA